MSVVIRYERFWMRRDTEANWISANPTLNAGEFGIVTDGVGMAMKMGDGSTAWNSLPYLHPQMATATGADTITATFDPKPVLVDGLVVYLKAAAANTTAVTFNPNSLGALAVKKQGGTALAAGDIAAAGHVLILVYRSSGTTWELLNPAQGSGGGGSVPTGTGFRHITAGVEDAIASLVYTADISNDQVTYAKMQNVSAASKLLGRGSASGSGDVEEITLGSGLSMSGTTISAPGGTGSAGAFEYTASSTSAVITSTTIPVDNTIPQNTEGAAYTDLDVTITPTASSSDLLVTIFFPYVTASAGVGFRVAVFRDSGANAVWAGFASVTTSSHQISATFVVPSSSTSSTTFTVRLGTSTGSIYINRDSGGSQYFGGVFKAIMAVKEML